MSSPRRRRFALLVLVFALAFPSVAQVTYSFSAPGPGVSWSFTVSALLTADTTITSFDSASVTGSGPDCTIPYVTISDPLGSPSVTTGLGSSCTFDGSWNKLKHQGYFLVSSFPSFNSAGTFIDPTQIATLTITGSYYVAYFANNAAPLGSTTDQIIRVSNVGLGGNPMSNSGNICEAVYVFDADQVMLACCQCVLTPNQFAGARVSADLTSSTLTGRGPNAGVVKIVLYPVGLQGTAPGLTSAATCNAVNSLSPPPPPGMVGIIPNAGLGAAFSTHLQVESLATFVTETAVPPQILSPAEAAFLPTACAFVRYLGSGKSGTCSCTPGATF